VRPCSQNNQSKKSWRYGSSDRAFQVQSPEFKPQYEGRGFKKKKKSPPTRMITYNNNKIQETR
jgi:hypothetical protein